MCVCAEREAKLCKLWQVPVSCCSCQLQLQVAIPVRGCKCERVKKQWAIANYLTPFQHADTAGLHYMHPPPLFTTPFCLPATAHHVACVDISCAAAKHLQSFRLQIYLSLLLLEEFKYQYNPCRHFTCNTYTQRVQLQLSYAYATFNFSSQLL